MITQLPTPVYTTHYGQAYLGHSLYLLKGLPDNSVDLVFTSPPFPLQRPKEYGNESQDSYVGWLLTFATEIKRVLKDTGSFVIDIGGAYQKDRPVRSLHSYKLLIALCEQFDFRLAEEFFWFNPAKLPSPIKWVNIKKIRVKDSVHTIWWLSKTDNPKANVNKVRDCYSESMKKLLKNRERYYKPKERPSGHDISIRFGDDNGGSIPSNFITTVNESDLITTENDYNLLTISNTESNSPYLKLCKQVGIKGHPARFPEKLPSFFIQFLTDPEDLVVDIFAGSNTTGHAAESLSRKWLAFEQEKKYVANSVLRFLEPEYFEQASEIYNKLAAEEPSNFVVPQNSDLLVDCS